LNLMKDPIVEEVRKARNEHAAKFNNNIDDIVKDVQTRQNKYGTRLVRRPPKMKMRATGLTSDRRRLAAICGRDEVKTKILYNKKGTGKTGAFFNLKINLQLTSHISE
jgi:hypothetical protein